MTVEMPGPLIKPGDWLTIDASGNAVAIEGTVKTLALAAPALLVAAKLACLNFERKNNSSASGDYLGDDDHEAWTALEKAVAGE